MTDSVESFSAMLRGALADRIDPAASSFAEMFAEDGVMEFPYALPGGTTRIKGRDALIDYLARIGKLVAFDRVGPATVHATADSSTVVIEFEGFGRGLTTGEPYEQRYVSIVRTEGGRIVHYRDYWNPLALLRATRGASFVAALAGEEAGRG